MNKDVIIETERLILRQCFISKSTGKIEDEYLTGLLKEEFVEYKCRKLS